MKEHEEEREYLKGIPVDEQETVVQFDRSGEYMTIYTTDSTVITKLEKCVEGGEYEVIEEHKLANGRVVGKTYKAKKKMLSFRSKVVKRELTEEQRQIIRENLAKARS